MWYIPVAFLISKQRVTVPIKSHRSIVARYGNKMKSDKLGEVSNFPQRLPVFHAKINVQFKYRSAGRLFGSLKAYSLCLHYFLVI